MSDTELPIDQPIEQVETQPEEGPVDDITVRDRTETPEGPVGETEPSIEPTQEPEPEPTPEPVPCPVPEVESESEVEEKVVESEEEVPDQGVLPNLPALDFTAIKDKVIPTAPPAPRDMLPKDAAPPKVPFSCLSHHFPTLHQLATWERPMLSVLVLLLSTGIWLLTHCHNMSGVQLIALIGAFIAIVVFFYANVLSSSAKFRTRFGINVDIDQLTREAIAPEAFQHFASTLHIFVNSLVRLFIMRLLRVPSPADKSRRHSSGLIPMLLGFLFLFIIGYIIDFGTMVYLSLIILIAWPKIYIKFHHEIDPILNKIVSFCVDKYNFAMDFAYEKAHQALDYAMGFLVKVFPFLTRKEIDDEELE